MGVNDDILDNVIRHAVQLSRLQKSEAAKIARLIQSVIPDIDAEITARLTKMRAGSRVGARRLQQLKSMSKQLKDMLNATKWPSILSSDMKRLALTEADWAAKMLGKTVPGDLSIVFNVPTVTLLHSTVTSKPFEGRILRDWTAGVNRSTIDRVTRTVNAGLVRGDDIRSMSLAVRDQLAVTKTQAEAVTRTAVNHISAQAREDTYAANLDVVKQVQWVSTLDTRTSRICRELDGQVFDVDKGPRPPAHFNCRSTTIPVLKSWKELGINARELAPSTRASMDGQVPQAVTYDKWLKRQPANVQEEVLGKAKAALFRKGKITAAETVR